MDIFFSASSLARQFYHRLCGSATEILLAIAVVLALFFTLAAVVGGFFTFSPVPFWDMWNHYLDFYLRLNSSDWSAWWRQNNEHRIILSRILFWLDFKLFDGGMYFLIVCNYLLALLAAVMFAAIVKSGVHRENLTRFHLVLIAVMTSLCFSWLQVENFSWGYQSQFFLAQSLPLVALYFLYKASGLAENSNRAFALAAVSGVACAGTMANGVLALPCMAMVALVANFSRRRVWILVLLSIAVATLYFYGYHAPKRHVSPLLMLRDHAGDVLQFVLAYLGAPFFPVFHGSLLAAQLAGAALVISSMLVAAHTIMARQHHVLVIALLGYQIYLFVSAFLTATGRVSFGIEYALSSRYATSALMAWCALFVILAIRYQGVPRIGKCIAVSTLGLVLALAPIQIRALQSYHEDRWERLIAALALELGVKDVAQIKNIYFNPAKALRLATQARHLGVSVFADPRFAGIREQIGSVSAPAVRPRCVGAIESITAVAGDNRYVKVSGWIYQPDSAAVPARIAVVDAERKIVGAVIAGQQRADIARDLGSATKLLGFKGYLLATARPNELDLVGDAPSCQTDMRRQAHAG